jgi:hypothetical protein
MENIFDLRLFLKEAMNNTKPSDITKFSVFDILEPESKSIKYLEKAAVLATISEVVAVISKICKYTHYEALIYGSLYASVVVTIFLPIAKFFDSIFTYKKLLKNLQENPLDRALVLSYLLGACSIIGREKMIELAQNQKNICIRILNRMRNFWDNTKIHGNFTREFDDIFGEDSFNMFVNTVQDLDDKYLTVSDIHNIVSPFFDKSLLWDNKKVRQAMRILNYKSLGEKVTNNNDIINSIDYLLLTYFKYGKSDVINDIEKFYIKNNS